MLKEIFNFKKNKKTATAIYVIVLSIFVYLFKQIDMVLPFLRDYDVYCAIKEILNTNLSQGIEKSLIGYFVTKGVLGLGITSEDEIIAKHTNKLLELQKQIKSTSKIDRFRKK